MSDHSRNLAAAAAADRQEIGENFSPDPPCLICGGDLRILGSLGDSIHYRCRCCGIEYSGGGSLAETNAAIARAILRGMGD
jgi:tRNA(Ile2) C34 agmatinyltransferase TiaS